MQSDATTIHTAEELFCAKHGYYGSADDLVADRFLANQPTLHQIETTAGGACRSSDPARTGQSAFVLTCDASDPACGNPGNGNGGGTGHPVVDDANGAWAMPASTTLPAGVDSRIAVLDGAGCDPHCGDVLRVVLLDETAGTFGAELWDRTSNTWTGVSPPPSTGAPEAGPMVLLNGPNCAPQCGNVLFQVAQRHGLWYLYDTHNDRWQPTGQPVITRQHGSVSAALITGSNCGAQCGKVLVAGGIHDDPSPVLPPGQKVDAELYDPSTGLWQKTGDMVAEHRSYPILTALLDGSVLLTDINSGPPAAERYLPASGTWVATGPLDPAVAGGGAVVAQVAVLKDGTALLTRPLHGPNPGQVGQSALYDPVANSWATAPPCARCQDAHSSVVLDDGGTVLVTGASGSKAVDLYSHGRRSWAGAADMGVARAQPAAARLPDGRVIVVGTSEAGAAAAPTTSEVFTPPAPAKR
jgi:hypothetical protein